MNQKFHAVLFDLDGTLADTLADLANAVNVAAGISYLVLGYLFVYSLSFALLAMALGMVGLDFVSSISAAAGALANLGPGFGAAVGPMNGFGNLPDAAKWLLAAGMLFGRLEMFAVLALFYRGFWRP